MTSHSISDGVKAVQAAPPAQLEHLGQEKQLMLRALGQVEEMDGEEGVGGHSGWMGGSRTELSGGSTQCNINMQETQKAPTPPLSIILHLIIIFLVVL